MQTVTIVGAGPAGLVAAKVLLTDGFDVTIFEKHASLSGIWSFEGAYYNLHTHQPGGTIEVSDLYDEYASWEHAHAYLCKYADKFDRTSHIRLRSQVLSIFKSNLHNAAESWSITVEQTAETLSSIETFHFDFVVIVSGLFSSYHMPSVRGQEKFSGSIVHANNSKSHEQLVDQKKISIGFAASNLYDDGVFKPQYALNDELVSFPVQPIFTELKRQNRIRGHVSAIEEIIDSNTVRLNTRKIFSPIDLIICSTDHYLRFPFLSDADAPTMGLPHETSNDFDLYRRLIPVSEPRIAFLGYVSSNGTWMIDEVASHCVSNYFKGVQLLPSREEMQKEILTIRDFVLSRFGTTAPHIRYFCLELIEIYLHYMDLPLRRTNNWWSENFGVYRPNRLKTLHGEMQARDRGVSFPNQFYFSFFHVLQFCFRFYSEL
ncbi:unnamed protein product [Rotaria magnacalcarata]|uniref:Flavin-containing monooxygenase n=1 Tax=Rotaria magnacalcarata TaxID=392030 RepID=A0A819V5M2_9BILA|nr:unnamed protein product [Rotaria magnacalcarata]CAF4101587.1 unnamed protein product [Rotaria magnacalcarata]CAF4314762.1 unnamed protein product [Rotaria magnacalcarata]